MSFVRVFDLRQRSDRIVSAFSGPSSTEDMMRIFDRLRGRDRNIERKLAETIASDLVRRIDEETPVTVVSERKSDCCSCCSADKETRQ